MAQTRQPASTSAGEVDEDMGVTCETSRPVAAVTLISAEVPDWSREAKRFFEWAPSRSLLASIRAFQFHAQRKGWWHVLWRKVASARHRFWSVITGADIPVNTQVGGGLMIPHPNGIVIHPGCKIGPNCLLFQQVTLGAANNGVPQLGGHIDVGAGAKVLGPISIGDHAEIGANAVVLHDVPAGATVVGIPARPVSRATHDTTATALRTRRTDFES